MKSFMAMAAMPNVLRGGKSSASYVSASTIK